MEFYFKISDIYKALDDAKNEIEFLEEVSKKDIIEIIKKEINLIQTYSLNFSYEKKERFSESSRPVLNQIEENK